MRMAIIGDLNGFRGVGAINKLALDPRVQEIEGGGMDEGRVFIHLNHGYMFGCGNYTHSYSIGSIKELKDALAMIESCDCKQCK